MKRVTIVGLGLIGGSIGLALRRAGAVRVAAIDHADVVAQDRAALAADELFALDDGLPLGPLRDADLVVLAGPAHAIIAALPAAVSEARVVTDTGSTKRRIMDAVTGLERRGRFVPGHPMAGAATGGLASARPGLFEGQSWLLCPEQSDADATATVRELIAVLGARPQEIGVDEHDRAVAVTSHVPQLFASALRVLAEVRGASEVAGPAFQDMTRVAGGPEAIWRDIFSTNREQVAAAIRDLIATLEAVAIELEGSEPLDEVLRLLARARDLRGD